MKNPDPDIDWKRNSFGNLPAGRLLQILKLRQNVFIIEQNCIYPDIDELDPLSAHLTGWSGGRLSGCLRIVPPWKKFDEPSLGRIVVDPEFRGRGIGSRLVLEGIAHVEELYGPADIRIEAQHHLAGFYGLLGFRTVSRQYLLDGIGHVQMIRYGDAAERKQVSL